MKKFIFIILISLSFNCISKSLFGVTSNALSKTKIGKNIIKNLERELQNKIPESMAVLAIIGIQQKIEFKIDKTQRIDVDYKDKSLSYNFNFGF